jgi:hypothetical protein
MAGYTEKEQLKFYIPSLLKKKGSASSKACWKIRKHGKEINVKEASTF